MRFIHDDGSLIHLSYCSNVHPAEDVAGIVDQIRRFARGIRELTGAPTIGLGLWVPAAAAREIVDDRTALRAVQAALREQCVEVVTMNAFPYGGFHDDVVKHRVYRPDWSERERFQYTLDCARLLAELLPEDVDAGSISTLPFAWPGAGSLSDGQFALARLAVELARLSDETGKQIRVAVEPEPGCIVETTRQGIDALASVAPEWIGLCLDMCHMAVQFEDGLESVDNVARSGLAVVKAQISSAVRVTDVARQRARVASFIEPRFLHQTRERSPDGEVIGVDDLPDALDGGLPGAGEWRIHHHQPIHLGGDATTQDVIVATLDALLAGPAALTHHLDVETYTWSVLPEQLRPSSDDELAAGIAKELRWVRDVLVDLGMKLV